MHFQDLNKYFRRFIEEHNTSAAEILFEKYKDDINAMENDEKFQLLEKMVILYFKSKNFKKCMELLQDMQCIALDLSLKYSLSIGIWRTNVLLANNKTKNALKEANKIRKLIYDSDYNNDLLIQDLSNLLIRIFIKMKKVKKVNKMYRKLLSNSNLLDSSKAKLFLNIGIMHYIDKNYIQAKKYFLNIIDFYHDNNSRGCAYMYMSKMLNGNQKLDALNKAYSNFEKINNQKYMKVINNEYKISFKGDHNI